MRRFLAAPLVPVSDAPASTGRPPAPRTGCIVGAREAFAARIIGTRSPQSLALGRREASD